MNANFDQSLNEESGLHVRVTGIIITCYWYGLILGYEELGTIYFITMCTNSRCDCFVMQINMVC
jgi:hypothetical protein